MDHVIERSKQQSCAASHVLELHFHSNISGVHFLENHLLRLFCTAIIRERALRPRDIPLRLLKDDESIIYNDRKTTLAE